MFQDKIVVGKIFSKFQKFFDNESEIRCKHIHFPPSYKISWFSFSFYNMKYSIRDTIY